MLKDVELVVFSKIDIEHVEYTSISHPDNQIVTHKLDSRDSLTMVVLL